MRKVELVKGIHSSVLGFGCAPILGSKDCKISTRAIEIALDNGINHFDLARSYGYGEAEEFVGKLIKSKRNSLVITSKFGIQANWKALLIRPLKPILRNLVKPNNKTQLENTKREKKSIADFFHERLEINSKNMKYSLEISLKALQTDHLDYLLIHEPIATIHNIDELFETVNRFKEEGKIKAFGLSSTLDQIHFHENYLNHFDLLQFNNSQEDLPYSNIKKSRGMKSNIIFSPLNGGSKHVTPDSKFKQLFNDFPRSVILCSMFNEKHLLENIKSAL